ncbi:UNVERIFIED_CONTAM: hypothetical protein PYX00_001529 [Menopon gallinae]|uniref:Ion transport domain-containing protein n=1 Tax=Menopon gallinae TaxID=328185 RepID=A0AAW2IF88_9NEOP
MMRCYVIVWKLVLWETELRDALICGLLTETSPSFIHFAFIIASSFVLLNCMISIITEENEKKCGVS